MKKNGLILIASILIGLVGLKSFQQSTDAIDESKIISHIVDPKKQPIQFFWKNNNQELLKNFQNLQLFLEKENKELVFAMNGGMFKKDFSPQGLYIEKGKILSELDTLKNGYGNFYLQPNGVFYLLKNNQPFICKTSAFAISNDINYATQSGPLLLIDGQINPAFNKGSKNVHIRNGVGVLPDGKLIFAISKEEINFYDFAFFFLKNGCKNALYLDGFVSRMYLPEKKFDPLDGEFGVMIGELKDRE